MSDIKLTTPEGYFDRSLERTMAGVSGIGKRRKSLTFGIILIVLVAGGVLSVRMTERAREREEYLALQSEMSRIDIFYEINQ